MKARKKIEADVEAREGCSRLIRMRESQRKLRTQRKHELEDLRQQNQQLLQEKARLELENYKLKNEFTIGFTLFDEEITSGQLEKLVTGIDLQDSTIKDLIPLEEFIKLGGFEDKLCLFDNEGIFLLKKVCARSLACMNRALKNYSTVALKDTPFRFVKSYGLQLMKYHIDVMRFVAKQDKVPKEWLDDSKVFPKGALSIVEVLNYISTHIGLRALNSYILCSFMSRYFFTTCQGMAMFEHDLLRCIEFAQSSNFDEAFLFGTVDDALCRPGDPFGPIT